MKLEIAVSERNTNGVIWEDRQTIFATVLSIVERPSQDSSQVQGDTTYHLSDFDLASDMWYDFSRMRIVKKLNGDCTLDFSAHYEELDTGEKGFKPYEVNSGGSVKVKVREIPEFPRFN